LLHHLVVFVQLRPHVAYLRYLVQTRVRWLRLRVAFVQHRQLVQWLQLHVLIPARSHHDQERFVHSHHALCRQVAVVLAP
jgi:hypothetical protein